MEKRVEIQDLREYCNTQVTVQGWLHSKRDQGKIIFLEIHDGTGIVQGLISSKNESFKVIKSLSEESVITAIGDVQERPDNNKNADFINGDIELKLREAYTLNAAQPIPFPIGNDTRNVNEEIRMQYRYLDLRNERMQKNLRQRHSVQHFLRTFLDSHDFIEVETPMLSAPTPEGARSFVVPSRMWSGNWYSLPQSPQQFKQLLMAGRVTKYFQFARCLRDEDTRGDRQPEFTQLDMELAFVTQEEVMQLNEQMLIELVRNQYPNKTIQQIPFPRLSYTDVMEQYGTDSPDLREEDDPNLLAFAWIVDFPMFEQENGKWTFTHNPFSRPKDEHFDMFMRQENIERIISTQYDVVLNGFEIGGGSLRNYMPESLQNTFEIIGYTPEEIQTNFQHILDAFQYGTPPHGGIAFGFDRLMMVLEQEKNIREVNAFVKTGDGREVMMKAPSTIEKEHQKELGLEFSDQRQAENHNN